MGDGKTRDLVLLLSALIKLALVGPDEDPQVPGFAVLNNNAT